MTDEIIFNGFEEPIENWSKLPHDLIEALPIISSLAEAKVILYVLRHTWGYREYDSMKRITYDEFMNGRKTKNGGRLDEGTGMSRQSVRDGLKRAVQHGFLVADLDDRDKARQKKYYALNYRGGNNSYAEGQLLTPKGLTSDPRTKKETKGKKLKKDNRPTLSRDTLNAYFDSICLVCGMETSKAPGSTVRKITYELNGLGWKPEDVQRFHAWLVHNSKSPLGSIHWLVAEMAKKEWQQPITLPPTASNAARPARRFE